MTRFRMLARLALLLLVAPLSATTAGALPLPPAAAALAVDVDADGDGLADAGDGCPTVASPNPTGCPTAARRAALTWLDARGRLQADVSSPVTSCSSYARIVLWRVRPDRDARVTAVTASARGRHRFSVRRGARYYVSVSPSYSPGEAECARAISRRVLAPRG